MPLMPGAPKKEFDHGEAAITVPFLGWVESRSRRTVGVMLKYPAVNVQDDPESGGDWSAFRIASKAGSSVYVSGRRIGVNCKIGYTTVEWQAAVVGLSLGFRSGAKTLVDCCRNP
jgi:hypothetical protein